MNQRHRLFHENVLTSAAKSQSGDGTSAGDTAGKVHPTTVANAGKERYIRMQRWLLVLNHANKCLDAEGQCEIPYCQMARQLCAHITQCIDRDCAYPRCNASQKLLSHYERCREMECPVCRPVRRLLGQQAATRLTHCLGSVGQCQPPYCQMAQKQCEHITDCKRSQEKFQHGNEVPTLIQYQQPHPQGPQIVSVRDVSQQHQRFQKFAGNGLISAAKSQTGGGTSSGVTARNVEPTVDLASKCVASEGLCQISYCQMEQLLCVHPTQGCARVCYAPRCNGRMEELQLPIQVPTLVQYKQSHQQGPQQARVKDMREHQLFQQVAGNRLISAAKSQARGGTSTGVTAGNVEPTFDAEALRVHYLKMQHLLLFLSHANKCLGSEGQCQIPYCQMAQQLCAHITQCHVRDCPYPRCSESQNLLRHYRRCPQMECPVCGPVLRLLGEQRATGLSQSSINPIAVNLLGDVPKSSNSDSARRANFSFPSGRRTAIHGTTQIEQPPPKRAKTEPASPNCAQRRVETTQSCLSNSSGMQALTQMQFQVYQQSVMKSEVSNAMKVDPVAVKTEQGYSCFL